jgi:hypothetical protein
VSICLFWDSKPRMAASRIERSSFCVGM